MGRKHSLKRKKPIHPISASSDFSDFVMDNENYSLTMAESYMKDSPSANAVGVSSSASGTKVVSLGRTRLQRANARNTSRSASNTSGSASIRITCCQSAKEVDVSQNNIKPTKKRKDSESSIHKRRHSKSFLKVNYITHYLINTYSVECIPCNILIYVSVLYCSLVQVIDQYLAVTSILRLLAI